VTVFRDITEERRAAEQSRLALTRLSQLERLADVALRASSVDALLDELLEVVRAVLGSDRATMLLLEGSNELVVRAAVGIDPDVAHGVRVPLGEGIAGTIASTRRPRVVDDLSKIEVVSAYLRERGGSLAGVPLVFQDRLLGVMHVSSLRTHAFGTTDLEYLKLAAERAAIALEQTRLFERERDIAAALQQSLLPERFPAIPGVTIAASYLPADESARVGGDWYDAFPLGDGRIIVAIGDIVGHGIGAAAAMGEVRNALRAYASEDPSPARVFDRINALLSEAGGQQFCTAFCAILDPWAKTITYSDAGHPAVLAFTAEGETRPLDQARSTPLGALRNARYQEATEPLQTGTSLFAYTDGLVERRGEDLEHRLELLHEAVTRAAPLPPRRFLDSVNAELATSTLREDDIAMIVVQVTASEDLRLRLPAEPRSLPLIRGALNGFLDRASASQQEILDLKVACGEACMNVIEHAYGTRPGNIRVNAEAARGGVAIRVADAGRWRRRHPRGAPRRGHGLKLMSALTDQLRIVPQEPSGTEVRMFRRIAG
jgi:serine phosphatase RsbU (regulator of sigma subunit)